MLNISLTHNNIPVALDFFFIQNWMICNFLTNSYMQVNIKNMPKKLNYSDD